MITNLESGEISCALWSDYCPAVQKNDYSQIIFLAVCALLIVSSDQGSAVSYCAYVSCTPMFKPVFWGDTDVLVYITVSISSPPWNDLMI